MAEDTLAGGGPSPGNPGASPSAATAKGRPIVREFFPYLCIRNASEAIDFYGRVYGAREVFRMDEDGGRVAHAELELGSTMIMISDEYPEMGIRGPDHWGGTPVRFHLHVDDVDGLAERTVSEGAVILRGPRDEAHGERQCLIRDPWGHEWLLGGPLASGSTP